MEEVACPLLRRRAGELSSLVMMGSFQWCELWGFVNVIAAAGDASASCGERMTDHASRPQLDQRMRSLGVAQDEDVKERHVHIRSPFLCRRFFVSICCYADAMRDAWRDGGPGFINGVGSSVGTCLHSTQSDGQMRAKFRGRGLQRSHLSEISPSFRGKRGWADVSDLSAETAPRGCMVKLEVGGAERA